MKQPFPVPVGLEVLDGLGLDPWEVAGRLPEMVDLLRAMFQECAAVASKLGVEFSVSFNAACRIRRSVGDYRTSTLRDLEAGKALETDCLTGASIMRDQTHSSRRGFPGVVDEGAFVAIVLLAVVWLIWLVGPALFLAQ